MGLDAGAIRLEQTLRSAPSRTCSVDNAGFNHCAWLPLKTSRYVPCYWTNQRDIGSTFAHMVNQVSTATTLLSVQLMWKVLGAIHTGSVWVAK